MVRFHANKLTPDASSLGGPFACLDSLPCWARSAGFHKVPSTPAGLWAFQTAGLQVQIEGSLARH